MTPAHKSQSQEGQWADRSGRRKPKYTQEKLSILISPSLVRPEPTRLHCPSPQWDCPSLTEASPTAVVLFLFLFFVFKENSCQVLPRLLICQSLLVLTQFPRHFSLRRMRIFSAGRCASKLWGRYLSRQHYSSTSCCQNLTALHSSPP